MLQSFRGAKAGVPRDDESRRRPYPALLACRVIWGISDLPRKKSAPSRLEDARARMYQDLIFESAEFIFGERGFENATMQEIASEAGVSLKTVYASFPGKQDLYNAIMLVRGREMFEAVEAAHRAAADPIGQLVDGTRAFVAYLFEHKDWSRIHVRSQTSWAMRPSGEVAAALWDAGQKTHVEMLEAGMESGIFHVDDPAEMALMLRAMTRVQVVSAIDQGEESADTIAERLIARLARMVCKSDLAIREVG